MMLLVAFPLEIDRGGAVLVLLLHACTSAVLTAQKNLAFVKMLVPPPRIGALL
jgi:hypothetical protein